MFRNSEEILRKCEENLKKHVADFLVLARLVSIVWTGEFIKMSGQCLAARVPQKVANNRIHRWRSHTTHFLCRATFVSYVVFNHIQNQCRNTCGCHVSLVWKYSNSQDNLAAVYTCGDHKGNIRSCGIVEQNRNRFNGDLTSMPTESNVLHNYRSNENNIYLGDGSVPGFAYPQYGGRSCSFNHSILYTETRSKGPGNGAWYNLKEGWKGGQFVHNDKRLCNAMVHAR